MSALRAFALFGLLAASQGCRVLDDAYTVKIDPTFSAEYQAAAVEAADAWQAATPVKLRTIVATCGGEEPGDICLRASDASRVPRGADANTNYGPWNSGAETFVDVRDLEAQIAADPSRSWARVVLFEHEMGHAMGLEHAGSGTVMATSLPEAAHGLTTQDVGQWLAVHGKAAQS